MVGDASILVFPVTATSFPERPAIYKVFHIGMVYSPATSFVLRLHIKQAPKHDEDGPAGQQHMLQYWNWLIKQLLLAPICLALELH